MDIRRSIKTRIWSDPWIEKLSPDQKLVWIYLLTNRDTNMLGIYEITPGRISYETGIALVKIEKILEDFERVRKAFYWFGMVILPNWIKNQAMNTNMLKCARVFYDELPNELIIKLKENGFESFESLSKGYLILPKIEMESEKENVSKKDDSKERSTTLSKEVTKTWKNDFETYSEDCKKGFRSAVEDKEFMKKLYEYYPRLDLKKSIEKSFTYFWSLKAGWKNKKKSDSESIDWKATIMNTISKNAVYLENNETTTPTSTKYRAITGD
jgi:hypothetical protein